MAPDALLGNVLRTFQPKKINIIAGIILGFAVIAAGVAAAVYLLIDWPNRNHSDQGNKLLDYVIVAVGGLCVPTAGVALVLWMRRLSHHKVMVCEKGLRYLYAGADEVCPWLDVAKIQEVFTHESIQVLKVPGAAIKNVDRSFLVYRKDGRKFRSTVNTLDSIPDFADHLTDARERHRIPWEQVEK